MSCKQRIASAIAILVLVLSSFCTPLASEAQTASATIRGSLVDVTNGLPVQNANVDLYRGDTKSASTTTDTNGSFSFSSLTAGVYHIDVRSLGYADGRSDDVFLSGDNPTVTLRTTLQRATLSSNDLRVIGRTTVNSSAQAALQTSATITREVNAEQLQRENYLRVGDALNGLPGVNLRGQSTSVGDDLYVDIRGLKPSETQTLLDGHPVGPIGVFAGNGGGYNYQDSPFFALANTQVTFGSGATGLYGVTAIGGTVDLQTINPTKSRQLSLTQSFGDQGRTASSFTATGTLDQRLGYAIVHGVQGTYGVFAPGTVPQTGVRGTDFTAATLSGITYPVSGNYLLRNDLLKLSYALTPTTKLTVTGYSANSWDDKTGEGDNDYQTYAEALYQGRQNVGSDPSCPNGVLVTVDSGNPCFTPEQFAAGSSGPAGGGQTAFQSISNQDFHARLTSQIGHGNVAVDSFSGSYRVIYHRDSSFLQGDLQINTTRYNTVGTLFSDDFAGERNDFGFGFYSQHQKVFGDDTKDTKDPATSQILTQRPVLTQNQTSYFVRDVYAFSPRLSAFANAWIVKSTVVNATTFDPRLSLVYRASRNDVFRLTGGKSDGQPAPADVTGAPAAASAGSINPGNCKTFNIGSISNPTLQAESAKDLEVAYGHRFQNDSSINVDIYDTNETNQIFSGAAPITVLGLSQTQLQAYFNRVKTICPNLQNPTSDNFTASTVFNAANARSRGIEFSGRARASRNLFFDAVYDVQSSTRYDVPDYILKRGSNVYIINGSQIASIPLHKASLGADFSDNHGFEARIDGYYLDGNNGLNRPAYTFANATVSKTFGKTLVNLGIQNLFNSAVDTYGRIGYGNFLPENRFGSDANAFDQGSERFGLVARNYQLSITQRI